MSASKHLSFPLGIAQLEPETAIPDLPETNLDAFFLKAHHWLGKAHDLIEREYEENKGGEEVTLTMNNREADFLVQGLRRLTVAMEKLALLESGGTLNAA